MSVPELRRLLNVARAEIRELREKLAEKPAVIERVVLREVVVERVIERHCDNPDHIAMIQMLQAKLAKAGG